MIWRDIVAVCVVIGGLLFALRGDSFRVEHIAHSSRTQQCEPSAVDEQQFVMAPSGRASVASFSVTSNNVTAERSTESLRVAVAPSASRAVLRLGTLGREVAVAVTSDLALLTFDAHTLALMWESHLGVHVRDSHHLVEIAILASDTPMRTGDTAGSIIVAGRLVRRAPDGGATLLLSTADEFFSFYAFDSLTGALRWKHESGDYESTYGINNANADDEAEATNSTTVNSRNVERIARLIHGIDEARGAARRSIGELNAQVFMRQLESLVDSVGVWRDPTDTRLVPVWLSVNSHAALHSTNGSGPHGYRNVLLARHRDGLEGVHLFSGRVVFRLPLEPHRLYIDANHDARLDSVELLYTHRSDVRDIEFIATEASIRASGQDPDVMRRQRLGSFANEVVPVLRVWADVPTSHLLFDVPLTGAHLHSGVFEVLSVAQQTVSTLNREVGDVFHETIFSAFEWLARRVGLASATEARASRDNDWDGGGHDAVPTVLRRSRESPLIVAMARTGAIYGIETRFGYQSRVVWRRRSPLLQHNVDGAGEAREMTESGGQLVPIEIAGQPAVLACGGLGVLLLDAHGRELAAALWPAEIRYGSGYITVLKNDDSDSTRVRFLRWSHNRFSVFEIVHEPAAALRPLLVLLGGTMVALVVVAILVADVPSLAAQLAESRRRHRRAAAAASVGIHSSSSSANDSNSDRSNERQNVNLLRGNDVSGGRNRTSFANKDL